MKPDDLTRGMPTMDDPSRLTAATQDLNPYASPSALDVPSRTVSSRVRAERFLRQFQQRRRTLGIAWFAVSFFAVCLSFLDEEPSRWGQSWSWWYLLTLAVVYAFIGRRTIQHVGNEALFTIVGIVVSGGIFWSIDPDYFGPAVITMLGLFIESLLVEAAARGLTQLGVPLTTRPEDLDVGV